MGARELWLNVVQPWQERRRLNDGIPNNARAMHRPVADRSPAAAPATAAQPVKRLKSQG